MIHCNRLPKEIAPTYDAPLMTRRFSVKSYLVLYPSLRRLFTREETAKEDTRALSVARVHHHNLRNSGRRTVHVRNAVFWFIGHKSCRPKKTLDFYWPQLLLIHHPEAGTLVKRVASSGHCFLHIGEFNSGFSRLAIILPFHENWYEDVCNSPKCGKISFTARRRTARSSEANRF